MFKVAGKQVLINCNHSNSDFYMIQWYKHSTRTNGMTLIGFARYDSQTVEGPFQALYNVSGDGRSASSLHFSAENEAHPSVIYFCAASEAHCCITRAVCNKNLTTLICCNHTFCKHFVNIWCQTADYSGLEQYFYAMAGHGITKDSLTRLLHEKSSLFPKPLQLWEPDQPLVFFRCSNNVSLLFFTFLPSPVSIITTSLLNS